MKRLVSVAFTLLLISTPAFGVYSTQLDQYIPIYRASCQQNPPANPPSTYTYWTEGPTEPQVSGNTTTAGYAGVCRFIDSKTFAYGVSAYVDYTTTPSSGESVPEPKFCENGSIIKIERMVLGETLPVLGTQYHLVYMSDFAPGYLAARSFNVVAESAQTNVGATGVSIDIEIGGHAETKSFPATGGTPQPYFWNGLGGSSNPKPAAKARCVAHERGVGPDQGEIDWPVRLNCGGGSVVNQIELKTARFNVGGWSLDKVHFYDSEAELLILGDGSKEQSPAIVNGWIMNESGTEAYVFNTVGQHIETRSGLTGAVLLSMAYNSNGQLISLTDSHSNVTTIQYASGKPISITSPFNQVTNVTVNSNNDLVSIQYGTADIYSMTYWTTTGLLKTFEKPSGEVSSFAFDSLGRLTDDSSNSGASTTLSSARDGNIITTTATSALGRIRTATSSGTATQYQTQELLPTGASSQYVSSDSRHLTFTKGNYSRYEVSTGDVRLGEAIPFLSQITETNQQQRSIQRTQTVTYSNPSLPQPFNFLNLTTVESINGGPNWTSVFDLATKTYTNTSAMGRTATVKIDAVEKLTQTQHASFLPVNYGYDTRGRLGSVTQGSRTLTVGYNSQGFVSSITNSLNQVNSFSYDPLGRILTATLPDSRVINLSYDSAGNIASITPPNSAAHEFDVNLMNLPTQYVAPAIGSSNFATTFAYNNDKQLTGVTRPNGALISYAYSPSTGLLDSVTAGSDVISYWYQTDRISSSQSADGVVSSFGYAGELLNSVGFSGSAAGTIALTYDQFFRPSTFQIGSGTTYTWLYDDDQLIKKVGNENINRSAATGFVSDTSLSNAKEVYSYDSTYGEVASYQAKYTTINKYFESYTRDLLGRISTRTVTLGTASPDVWEYTYDPAGRLTTVTKNSSPYGSYTYDSNSNRTAATRNGVTISATYDAQDRLLTHGTRSYTYNLNGERLTQTDSSVTPSTTNYIWDAFGNLKQVTLPSSTQIKYRYDSFNRRVTRMTGATVNERYVYLDQLRVAAVLNSSGATAMTFFYGDRQTPEYMIKSGTTYKLFVDHVGSVRQVINASNGTVAQEITYDEFGRVLSDSSPGFQPFGFAGGLYDKDTKLTQFGARWYDAEAGRWISKDPILFAGGDTNLYGYVLQDPVNLVDLTGQRASAAHLEGSGPGGSPALGQLAIALGNALSKWISEWQWKNLQDNTGEHPEQLKERMVGKDEAGKWDLYLEKDGRISIRPWS
jgi:RHS repeat-associated protein